MASRKEQKEQARAARIAQEQGAAAKAQRTRRLQIFGGVIAIAVIVIVAWQWLPFAFLILFTAIQSLDQEQKEAARIDGAGALGAVDCDRTGPSA